MASEPFWLALLWAVAVALTTWSFGFTRMRGSDLWWHLAAGRWIWTTRSWPFTDPWSFTHLGQPWLHHEWLSDIVYHAWASLFGIPQLVWWKWAVLVSTFVLLFRVMRRVTDDSLASYLASLLALAVGAPFFDMRPHLYSVFGYVLVLRLVWLRSRFVWLLPLCFLIWVNLHGGFFFGLMALGVVLAAAWLHGEAPLRSPLLWLACVGVCLLNPNGVEAYTYPLKYAFETSSPFLGLGEWRPPSEPGGIVSRWYHPSIGVFGAAAVVFVLSSRFRRQRWVALSGFALGALTLAMSLRSRRFIPLFGISQSLVLAPALAVVLWAARQHLAPRLPLRVRTWPLAFVPPVLAAALGVAWLAPYPRSANAFLSLTAEDTFPVEALNFIVANDIEGKVFALYNWGGYIDLRTGGRLLVYIDGRADTVFDDETYGKYTQVLSTAPGWEGIVNASGADYVLWPKSDTQVGALLRSGRWRLLYTDYVSVLLTRADWPVPTPLKATPDTGWRELALAGTAWSNERLDEAEVRFRLALQLTPNLSQACYGLVRVQASTGRLADAHESLERCQRIFPDAKQFQEWQVFLAKVARP